PRRAEPSPSVAEVEGGSVNAPHLIHDSFTPGQQKGCQKEPVGKEKPDATGDRYRGAAPGDPGGHRHRGQRLQRWRVAWACGSCPRRPGGAGGRAGLWLLPVRAVPVPVVLLRDLRPGPLVVGPAVGRTRPRVLVGWPVGYGRPEAIRGMAPASARAGRGRPHSGRWRAGGRLSPGPGWAGGGRAAARRRSWPPS